jgi:hypothetical protein
VYLPKSGKAVASLILGCVSFFLPIIGSVLAIVLGHSARADIRRSAGTLGGRGLATGGLVLGYATLVMWASLIAGGALDEEERGGRSTRQENVLREVAGACRGERLTEAGTYRGPGPFHLVVVGDQGRAIDWSRRDAPWRAETVEDTELVACVARSFRLIETCLYNGPDINRYEEEARVRVVTARTGRHVSSFTVTDQPRACRFSEPWSLTRLEGNVQFGQVSSRLGLLAAVPA